LQGVRGRAAHPAGSARGRARSHISCVYTLQGARGAEPPHISLVRLPSAESMRAESPRMVFGTLAKRSEHEGGAASQDRTWEREGQNPLAWSLVRLPSAASARDRVSSRCRLTYRVDSITQCLYTASVLLYNFGHFQSKTLRPLLAASYWLLSLQSGYGNRDRSPAMISITPSSVNGGELNEPEEFLEIGGSPMPGVTLRHLLRGHMDWIGRIAWSPDGRRLSSPSSDKTIRIWDLASGTCSATLVGHSDSVHSVAWSPNASELASGSADNSVRVWDVAIEQTTHVFEGYTAAVRAVAWSRDGQLLATGSEDYTVRVWDLQSKECAWSFRHSDHVTMLEWSPDGKFLGVASDDATLSVWDVGERKLWKRLIGHDSFVITLAWSPDGRLLASGSADRSIRIWDAQTGKQNLVLENHLTSIRCVAFSHDGSLLASKSLDRSVRIWGTSDWQLKASLVETNPLMNWHAGLSFHPHLSILATLGEKDTAIRIWDIDLNVLLDGQSAREAVHYISAKLVLVGDSGVGKTGLGWRLAHGEFKEHASTHGQQFWVLEDLRMKREDGTECEAVLWDLAGQHVYRPVHAIFLDDVDAALVLFDPTNRHEPLKGAQFWLEQLARQKKLPPAVLVGARDDRGAPVLSREDFAQFCQRYGISGGYISTSAKEGHGLDDLIASLKAQIPWDQMTTTVTTVTFKRIKEYVLALKEQPDRHGVLVASAALRAQLEATDPKWQFSDAEMMTAVKHLANHGYVAVLRSSSGDEAILLVPELLVDLAASIVLQADKHPRELGLLSEAELLQAKYPFPELANLDAVERQIMLDAALLRFLEHNICFRETLGTVALLIFPGLIKQKRPLFDDGETVDDVSYTVGGRVENVYAALVVLLGYTQMFTRVNQWQNQAQYELGTGEICGFRLIEDREGQIELVLYYSPTMPDYGRTLFQGLFEKILYQRDVDVTRFPLVVCPNGHRQVRATVVKRLREGKAFLFCDECGSKIRLPEIERPVALGGKDARSVQREEALARLRGAYETHLVRVKGFRRDRAAPRCYISHLPEQSDWVAQLAQDLRAAGVYVLHDRAQVQDDDFVILVSTPAYKQQWDRLAAPIDADIHLIRSRLRQDTSQWPIIIPLLRAGELSAVRPHLLRDRTFGDFRDDTRYAVELFDLVLTLYAISFLQPAFDPLRRALAEQWQQALAAHSDSAKAQAADVHVPQAEDAERQQARNVLEAKQRRLRALELQLAQKGASSPPELTIEIEDLRKEIADLLQQC
jgi:small GTP-binding protein